MPYAQGRGLQSGQHGGPDSPGDIAQFRCDDRWIPLIRRAAAERRDQGIREQIKVLSGRAAENNPVGAENGQQCGQSRRNLSSVATAASAHKAGNRHPIVDRTSLTLKFTSKIFIVKTDV
jgi:hypothetical protein